jgi:hypothetical protein
MLIMLAESRHRRCKLSRHPANAGQYVSETARRMSERIRALLARLIPTSRHGQGNRVKKSCGNEACEKLSSHAATLRLRRMLSLPGAFRIRLWAMCFRVVKLAGAWSVRMRHSSSRKIMSMTQCRLFSTAQRLRMTGPRAGAPTRPMISIIGPDSAKSSRDLQEVRPNGSASPTCAESTSKSSGINWLEETSALFCLRTWDQALSARPGISRSARRILLGTTEAVKSPVKFPQGAE